jgi:hypothetical protein
MIGKEKELQQEKIAALMDKVSVLKKAELEVSEYFAANILGDCLHWLHKLHMENVTLTEENEAMNQHWKFHFAGLAMQGMAYLLKAGYDNSWIAKQAFEIADLMVKYGKKEKAKTKGTKAGLGTTRSKDSNTEQP